jgi:transposase
MVILHFKREGDLPSMSVAVDQSQVSPPAAQVTPVAGPVVVGVDTHQQTHHAAVIDLEGRGLGDRVFAATEAGYDGLIAWVRSYSTTGALARVGVESTGSYGAGLARRLSTAGVDLYEVNRPEKTTRVKHGKSDPVDAYCAAEQVRTGRARGRAKLTSSAAESLRMLKVPRDSAVRERTRAYCQLRDLITAAPAPIHDTLINLTGKQRLAHVIRFRVDPTRLADPVQAAKYALRALGQRIKTLDIEIHTADHHITRLVRETVPTLLAMRQVGPQTAAQLLITAGQNIDRMHSEAAFAKLTGVAPLPASSGKTNRHRLNRGGDRQANSALYMIIVGRMKNHPETRAYVQRRAAQNMTKAEIIRCLKRHLARAIYQALRTDLATLDDL